jgi:hypothetical protein
MPPVERDPRGSEALPRSDASLPGSLSSFAAPLSFLLPPLSFLLAPLSFLLASLSFLMALLTFRLPPLTFQLAPMSFLLASLSFLMPSLSFLLAPLSVIETRQIAQILQISKIFVTRPPRTPDRNGVVGGEPPAVQRFSTRAGQEMPSNDYIPANDAQFSLWAQAFANGISANSALYMLTPAQAASIQSVTDNFVAALLVATTEATRTKATIIAKDNARSVCESLCRQYAILIKNNVGIDDADKVNIGVRPINPDREPIECPQTSPLLNIIGNTPGSQTVVYADSLTPDSKARPFGASELQLFRVIGNVESAPLSEANFLGKFTRNPIAVEFSEADDGKIATYYGRWASVRGETGPWSLPVSMRIAA